jgi:hypothetical protein
MVKDKLNIPAAITHPCGYFQRNIRNLMKETLEHSRRQDEPIGSRGMCR